MKRLGIEVPEYFRVGYEKKSLWILHRVHDPIIVHFEIKFNKRGLCIKEEFGIREMAANGESNGIREGCIKL